MTMAEGNDDVRETLDRFFRAVESREPNRMAPFKAIGEALKQMPTPIRIDPQEMVVREFGEIALVTFHLKLPGPLHRRSFILRKRDGHWHIAHIHASIASAT